MKTPPEDAIGAGHGIRPPVLSMTPSRPRVVFGAFVLGVVSILLIDMAVRGAFGVGTRLTLLALASSGLMLALAVWRSGAMTIEFDGEVLREASGPKRVLARVSEIRGVDRGAFAFKPSNGFLLRLSGPAKTAWVPGLWWRGYRLVGVGGLIPGHQTKLVAEVIAIELARRDGRMQA